MTLTSSDKTVRAGIIELSDGTTGIVLNGPDGKPRFLVGAGSDGEAEILLNDHDGKTVWREPTP